MSGRKAKEERRQFIAWGDRALKGLPQSASMLAVWDEHGDKEARYEFMLQVGYTLVSGKPLIIIAPRGVTIPPALVRAAAAVEFFDLALGEPAMHDATLRALKAIGVEPHY